MNILPHNNADIAGLNSYEAIDVVNGIIDSMQSEIDVAEYQVSIGEDPHIQVEGMRNTIGLHKVYLDYLWTEYSKEYSLLFIEDEYVINTLPIIEVNILIFRKKYFYACIKEIDSVVENLSIWGFCTLDAENEKQALLNEIELLEEQIQRSLV